MQEVPQAHPPPHPLALLHTEDVQGCHSQATGQPSIPGGTLQEVLSHRGAYAGQGEEGAGGAVIPQLHQARPTQVQPQAEKGGGGKGGQRQG